MRRTAGEAAGSLVTRLQHRRHEIEATALARVRAVSHADHAFDAEYAEGVRVAIGAAVDYALSALKHPNESAIEVPSALIDQARLAARHSVGLDTVVRRYLAGYGLLSDLFVQEAEDADLLPGPVLRSLLQEEMRAFERLIAAVTQAYKRELDFRHLSTEQRQVERVRRLLAGEFLDTAEFAYNFDGCSVAVVAHGAGAFDVLRGIAKTLDLRLMHVRPDPEVIWAWLGSSRLIDDAHFFSLPMDNWPAGVRMAIGEAKKGILGWRSSHQQAKAAMAVAIRNSQPLTRYVDVALLASMLGDSLLVGSLQETYMSPLAVERDGGAALRQTLRAYFSVGRNVSSAAASLGVSRQTVINRLHTVEARLGRTVDECAVELEAVLRIEEFGESAESGS
jgi:hypothetical protein